ncbi:TPA: autotransporter outer membrane beta-barrel domain-containing protein [Yersinia enterocolitica]|uniref:autotransporter family protein n=1 Tax=Yersinia enterocolitica TaxID=630 RepID=UPI00065A815D|nr:autotransporter outer membrane beta-barrel domain-containing protein [Yersinia enterocolitica]CRY01510.1 putative autotransporter protein [Yersinia enterocolitica]HDM8288981.1 autotransporter outer membrane beta-barrel domain-containing protein [Yersinia enterocolitica]HDM8292723.1 autotransporter outer membrane beta-barrel domain-containing protein [Yersinia enterocolitica]HDM8318350.1 autotransporter outer membrane beta-barrel domain-containing protein [Yersinia enterocolitica]HDM8330195.
MHKIYRFIKTFMVSCPVLLGGFSVVDAKAETTLNTQSGPIYLSLLGPETQFVVADNATITAITDSAIYGDNSANWRLIVYGSVIDNPNYFVAAGVVHLNAKTAAGSQLDNYGILAANQAGNGVSGVKLDNGGVVVNHVDAQISSLGSYGIVSSGALAAIWNDGAISGYSSGVRLASGGSVIQSATGTLVSSDGAGILSDSGIFSVNNAGSITANGAAGILARGNSSGSISNSGTITGPNAIAIQGNAGMIINNTGTLTGTNGTAVDLSGSNNQLILDTGSVINGKVVSRGSNNTLALLGDGTATNDFSGLTSVSAIGTGLWTLGGHVTTTAASTSALEVQNGKLIITGQLTNSGVGAAANVSHGGILQIGTGLSRGNLISDVNIEQSGTFGGYGSVTGKVNNAGNLIVGQALSGEGHGEFTINGDYHGQGGTVVFDTDMAADNAATDKLIINGSTSGESHIRVQSAHGEGAQTYDGIKIITVNGRQSDGQFNLLGRAVAGPYEYFLQQGTLTDPDNKDWYLRSTFGGIAPVSGDTGGGAKDIPASSKTLRPEAGGYMANLAAAQTLFNLRLNDREGRAENSSMWLRQVGSRTGFSDGSGQLHSTANAYVVQGGGEVLSTAIGKNDRLGVGVMAGYGYNNNQTQSNRTGYKSRGTLDGYSAGIYATWYQDAKNQQGAYVDSWLQYSKLNASEQGDELAMQSYNINGLSASVESGYRMPVYHGVNGDVFVTPQAQVIWDGQKADTVHDDSNTQVQSTGADVINTRIGVRVARDSVSDQDKGKDKLFTVYSEVNWLHNSKDPGVAMDNITVSQAGSRNVGEIKLGAEGKLNKNCNAWANVGQQIGGSGYNDSRVTAGLKYAF